MMKLLTVFVFLSCYVLLIQRKGKPPFVVWTGAAILMLLRVITPVQALQSININVIGIFLGTMVLSEFFIHSQVPAYLSALLVSRSKSVAAALLAVCVLAGMVSAVVDNVATVLMIAPIAMAVSKRLKVSPVPFLIGIAVSANLQGAATMVGDSTSILLASAARMSFADFFWMNGRPGMFFAVQFGSIFAWWVLGRVFARSKGRIVAVEPVAVTSWVPTVLMVLTMVTMALSSFIPNRPDYTIGLIALAYALVALFWNAFTRYKEIDVREDIDWSTVFLLCGLFVLIGSLTAVGIISDIAGVISSATRGNSFLAYNILVWMSVIISAFVDNIPYTMAMLPVAQLVATNLGVSPYVMMFGMMIGTTLGGNITPIGASANVVAVSILRKEGQTVTFGEFARIGLPFTIAAVVSSAAFVWLLWH
ncbi:MAG: SLC13 family permease [Chloroflexota bacterium]